MVISIASQKSGVGKTSTAISLAAGLARRGKKTLLVDIDSQANSSKVLLPRYQDLNASDTIHATILERKPLPVHKTEIKGLYIVPSHILVSNADIELTIALDHREARLKTELDKIKNDYDVVIIDCPPTLSWLTINALTASEDVIVVVSPATLSLIPSCKYPKLSAKYAHFFNEQIELRGFLFTMSDPTINT